MFKKVLWVFTRANDMKDHIFTDSVALTTARTKEEAIEHFSRLYDNVQPDEVLKPYFNHTGVAILTNY